MRVLENLKNMIHETNEHTLPKCREIMQDNLNHVLQRCKPALLLFCFVFNIYIVLFQMNAVPKCISFNILIVGGERILNQNVQIGSPATENIDYLVIHVCCC